MLSIADGEEVSEHRQFLTEQPTMPMLFVGSGGSNGVFSALLYGMNTGIGKAMTPLQFASLSDNAVKNSRILLLSKSGKNDDIVYAANRAVKINPTNTACLTFQDNEENKMVDALRGTEAKVFMYDHPEIQDGFTSLRGKFYKHGLIYRAFTGANNISSKIEAYFDADSCFKYEVNGEEGAPVGFEKIEHYLVLYGGFGEPVAADLESVFAETGLGSVQMCDYRNYCHGRFVFASNHTENDEEPRRYSNVAVVLLITPREQSLAKRIRKFVIPSKTPVVTIETSFENPLATLDLMIKANVLIAEIGEGAHGINPYSPQNYSGLDKRAPITAVKFKETLNKFGNLSYYDADTITTEAKPKKNQEVKEKKAASTPKKSTAKYKGVITCTDDFAYFYQGIPLSNWWTSPAMEYDGHTFYSSEAVYMYKKAMAFNDTEVALKIVEADNDLSAKEQARFKKVKSLGREVRIKSMSEFLRQREQWMYEALELKLEKDERFREVLLSEAYFGKTFVEASPWDDVWGIKSRPTAEVLQNGVSAWKGKNLLGKTLTRLRDNILQNKGNQI